VELVSFLQWVQTNVPDVPIKILKDIQDTILVVVVIATNFFFFKKQKVRRLNNF